MRIQRPIVYDPPMMFITSTSLGILFALSFVAIPSFAQYEEGRAYCERIANLRHSEVHNDFVEVPIDYKDPAKGKTEIYYHLSRKFDPELPTMIYFTGGPGGASHFQGWPSWDQVFTLNANLVLFDQRGIACSRPKSEELHTNVNFYSSENTARDAEEIRKHLGAKKVSVYGVSYGTVPATIYASIFPEVTTSLIVEGVVHSGFEFEELSTPARIRLLQKFFDSLPEEMKARWNRWTAEEMIDSMWFPQVIGSILSQSGQIGWDSFKPQLMKALSEPDDQKALSELGVSPRSDVLIKGEIAELPSEGVVNKILFCKEFGASVSVPPILVLEEGKVGEARGFDGKVRKGTYGCGEFGLDSAGATKYLASNYPVKAPVYYLQGTLDSSTPPRGAIYHYKSVPKEPAYMVLFRGGGHQPSGMALVIGMPENSPFTDISATMLDLFLKAINGEAWTKSNTKNLNKYDFKISFTSK